MRKIDQRKTPISCAVCLNVAGKRVHATTVAHGYAVCDDHIELVEQPGFTIATLERRHQGPL